MMSLRRQLSLTIILLATVAAAGQDQSKINLTGLWKTDQGSLVNIEHANLTVTAKFLGARDCASGGGCPLPTSPDYYLKGAFTGQSLTLSMIRCTHPQDMRDDGIADHWNAKTTVSGITETTIAGTYRSEWYLYDTKDGKRVNFRRDPSGDRDMPFALVRTNCKKELERLVAEIERLAKIWREQEAAIDDVLGFLSDAQKRWYQSMRDTFKEEVFDGIVKPEIRVIPGAFDHDIGRYISSWTDFAMELEQKKRWSYQIGSKGGDP